ncbi:PPC domain-containing protein [Paludisphaera soli]|uniref:PPC domain-containing protein n=1 Tax=Paludisphaera soli TaxID=2712865 RepID=UPI0013EBAA6F|nr:PPC domain-containing protein [Paludisphaera soli]
MRRRSFAASLLTLTLVVAGPATSAKPPTLTGFFPAGAARGQSQAVTISGTFDHWPVQCWVDGEGLAIKPGDEKGKLTIEVAADAAPGLRWVRVHDEEGASSPRPFLIGTLPEVAEAEPNDDPRQPQPIEGSRVTVNGKLAKRGDVDGFSVTLEKGQVLAADLEANRRLGSPMDAVLQVVSADGFVLAQNDDAVGRDPRIVFEAPAPGVYTVRLFAFPATPDSTIRFAGGDAYTYRLTLTTGGFIENAFPLAVSAESATAIRAVGPNIAETDSVLEIPAGDQSDRILLTHPSLAGDAEVRRVAGPAIVEVEPNDPATPQALPDRGSVSGTIDPPGDRDAYRITLKKGDARRFRLECRSFGLPLDAVLQVLDADGKTLAEVDDSGNLNDPEVAFAPPADGDFRVVVRDLNGRGGPRHAYLLGVIAPEPDFRPSLAADAFTMTPGATTQVVVAVDRKDGHVAPIEVTAEDLPEGVAATTVVSHPADASAKVVTIELRAEASARSGPFRVVARSADGLAPRPALAKLAEFEAETDRPWVTILADPEAKKP